MQTTTRRKLGTTLIAAALVLPTQIAAKPAAESPCGATPELHGNQIASFKQSADDGATWTPGELHDGHPVLIELVTKGLDTDTEYCFLATHDGAYSSLGLVGGVSTTEGALKVVFTASGAAHTVLMTSDIDADAGKGQVKIDTKPAKTLNYEAKVTTPAQPEEQQPQVPPVIVEEDGGEEQLPPVTVEEDGEDEQQLPPVTVEEEQQLPPVTVEEDEQEQQTPPVIVEDDEQEHQQTPPVVVQEDEQEQQTPPVTIEDDEQEQTPPAPKAAPDSGGSDTLGNGLDAEAPVDEGPVAQTPAVETPAVENPAVPVQTPVVETPAEPVTPQPEPQAPLQTATAGTHGRTVEEPTAPQSELPTSVENGGADRTFAPTASDPVAQPAPVPASVESAPSVPASIQASPAELPRTGASTWTLVALSALLLLAGAEMLRRTGSGGTA